MPYHPTLTSSSVHHSSHQLTTTFLARLLILIKKGGLLQLKFGVVGVGGNIYCGRDNLKSFSCILPKFVMHVTNDQFSDKLNNGRKKIQNGRLIVLFRLFRQ